MLFDLKKHGVTQSILQGFLKCRVYADLSIQGWTSLKTGASLQFGEITHTILEKVYVQVRDDHRDSPPDAEEINQMIEDEVEAWEKSPRGSRAGGEAHQQLQQNAALLQAVLPGYFKFWGKEDFKKVKWVDLEKEFEVMLCGIKFRGKIDGVFRDASKGLNLLETKTKGRIEEQNLSDLLAFDFQTDTYALAAEKIYGELPKGARYNILRRPGERQLKGESLESYTHRVGQRVLKEPKHYFIRYRIDKPRVEIKEFRRQLELKVKEFVAWREGKLPTYRNETACLDRYGACRFLPICANKNYNGFYKRDKFFQELNANGL